MSFRAAKMDIAEAKIPLPSWAVGAEVAIFQTQPHVIVELATQPCESLVGKHSVRITPAYGRASQRDPVGVQDGSRDSQTAAHVRSQAAWTGALEPGVDQKRHIGKGRVNSRRVRNRINRVYDDAGLPFGREPIRHVKAGSNPKADAGIKL